MKLLLFGKHDCEVCEKKALPVLAKLGVPVEKASIDPADYKPEDMLKCAQALADASWYDLDPDHLPLVVAVCGECQRQLPEARWTGRDVTDKENPWLPKMRAFVKDYKKHGGCK